VTVVCRFRPFNESEKARGVTQAVEFNDDSQKCKILLPQEQMSKQDTNFTFDRVFDMNSNQKEVYDAAAKPIIDSVLDGFNGTIFAYGQTSSGKTHTMQGPSIEDIELQGIIPRMVRTVFTRIETASEDIMFSVHVSMVEIYNERIKDLIDPSKDNLRIHEKQGKGVYLQDVSEIYIEGEN